MKCIFCRINNLIHVFNYVNNEISNNYDYAIDQVLTSSYQNERFLVFIVWTVLDEPSPASPI